MPRRCINVSPKPLRVTLASEALRMKAEAELNRLQWFLMINSALGIEYLFAPVMTIFYLNYVGLNFSAFSFFIASIFLLNVILEVPTGVISDTIGRKRAYVLAGFFYLAAMLILLVFGKAASLIAAALCFSIGGTLASGNLD